MWIEKNTHVENDKNDIVNDSTYTLYKYLNMY